MPMQRKDMERTDADRLAVLLAVTITRLRQHPPDTLRTYAHTTIQTSLFGQRRTVLTTTHVVMPDNVHRFMFEAITHLDASDTPQTMCDGFELLPDDTIRSL